MGVVENNSSTKELVMGEEQAEEKKSKSPSLDSVFDEGAKLPKFGAEEAAPLPKLPSPSLTSRSHGTYQISAAQPDEEALDWRRYVTPKDPGPALNRLDLEPGQVPDAPNTHQERTDQGQRQLFWNSYGASSRSIEAVRAGVATDYQSFMMAQANPDLAALGFTMSSPSWKGDASSLADEQKLAPNLTAKNLFRGDGSINLTGADRAAMKSAGHLVMEGVGAKQQHDDLIGADSHLRASVSDFARSGAELDVSRSEVESAEIEIEKVKLQNEVAEDREALEKAQHHVELVKSGLEFIAGGLIKFAVVEAKEAGDLVESIGSMAAYAVARHSDASISSLEEKLQADTNKLQTAAGRVAYARFEAAKKNSLGRVHAFRAARQRVIEAIQARQKAHVAAGKASAASSGGSSSSRAKISGVMAAIPAAELLLGLVKSIATISAEASAKYTEHAGSGFHMAVYDHRMQPTHLVSALDQLTYLQVHFGGLTVQWAHRLASLQEMQTRLGGARPNHDIGAHFGEAPESEGAE